jgi:hypothetical protein
MRDGGDEGPPGLACTSIITSGSGLAARNRAGYAVPCPARPVQPSQPASQLAVVGAAATRARCRAGRRSPHPTPYLQPPPAPPRGESRLAASPTPNTTPSTRPAPRRSRRARLPLPRVLARVPCRAAPCRVALCRAVPRRAAPCRAVPIPAVLCRAVLLQFNQVLQLCLL